MKLKMKRVVVVLSLKIVDTSIPTLNEITFLRVTMNSRPSNVLHILRATVKQGAWKSVGRWEAVFKLPKAPKSKLSCYKQLSNLHLFLASSSSPIVPCPNGNILPQGRKEPDLIFARTKTIPFTFPTKSYTIPTRPTSMMFSPVTPFSS